VAKGKKVMFVFILEVLDGSGPKPGSFWTAPKKCHYRLLLPKLPEVPPREPPAPPALPAVQELSGCDVMTGVEPSAPINPPPPPTPTPGPLPPLPYDDTVARRLIGLFTAEAILTIHPFPQELDRLRIVRWGHMMLHAGHCLTADTLDQMVDKAGHTGECAQRIIASLSFLLPLAKPFWQA